MEVSEDVHGDGRLKLSFVSAGRNGPPFSFRGCKEEQDIITQNKHCLERKADEERVLNIALVSLAFSTIWMGSHSY